MSLVLSPAIPSSNNGNNKNISGEFSAIQTISLALFNILSLNSMPEPLPSVDPEP